MKSRRCSGSFSMSRKSKCKYKCRWRFSPSWKNVGGYPPTLKSIQTIIDFYGADRLLENCDLSLPSIGFKINECTHVSAAGPSCVHHVPSCVFMCRDKNLNTVSVLKGIVVKGRRHSGRNWRAHACRMRIQMSALIQRSGTPPCVGDAIGPSNLRMLAQSILFVTARILRAGCVPIVGSTKQWMVIAHCAEST